MLQIAVNGSYHRPSVLKVDTQYRVEEPAIQHQIDILFDIHGRGVLEVAGQSAGSHHAPESLFFYEQTRLLGQGASNTVVLMTGMDHDVRTVKRRPLGIVIEERTTSGKNIPRVIQVKIQHAQPKRKMHTGHRIAVINGNELTLREDLAVRFEFFERVRFLGGVNELANLDNGCVVQGFHETNSVVGWKHGGSSPVALCRVIGLVLGYPFCLSLVHACASSRWKTPMWSAVSLAHCRGC